MHRLIGALMEVGSVDGSMVDSTGVRRYGKDALAVAAGIPYQSYDPTLPQFWLDWATEVLAKDLGRHPSEVYYELLGGCVVVYGGKPGVITPLEPVSKALVARLEQIIAPQLVGW